MSDVLSIELPNKPAKSDQDCVHHTLVDGTNFDAKKRKAFVNAGKVFYIASCQQLPSIASNPRPSAHPFMHHPARQLGELECRDHFLAGIDLILAGIEAACSTLQTWASCRRGLPGSDFADLPFAHTL
ncbi:hypothetical protein [Mesorhizobium sp. B2-3-13]|uniref:hypothetical protein n=1 Tax=Mesorhizobium sp. B2-3-13 TaxID=2589951 RepID=UPI001FEE0C9C|nr:hypothetical protein [Mesorhizobium sp. B2-3-13]